MNVDLGLLTALRPGQALVYWRGEDRPPKEVLAAAAVAYDRGHVELLQRREKDGLAYLAIGRRDVRPVPEHKRLIQPQVRDGLVRGEPSGRVKAGLASGRARLRRSAGR